jgi:hypothetical protein
MASNDITFRPHFFRICQLVQKLKGEKHAKTGPSSHKPVFFLEKGKWAE